jgi:putative ABC transport system permease protein
MGRPRVDLVTTLILQEITSKIEKSDRDVRTPRGPPRDGSEHWATGLIDNLSVMMSALGVMSIVLSGFLVTNTISALLAQQTRQIGIMKAIGARTTQMMMMYMVLVLGFGMLSLLVAIPATLWATDVFVNVVADYFNFDLSQAIFPQDVLRLQIIAGLAIPVVASLIPVFRGTRVTVLEALNDITIETRKSKARKEFIKKVFWWIFLPVRLLFWPIRLILTPIWRLLCYIVVGALKRPLLLAVRNTFRRKVRVSLTLFTLMIGGLIFIGIFSIRTSLINTLNTFIDREFQFDAVVLFDKSYRDYYIIDEAERVPGVALAEPWLDGSVSRIYPDDTESDPISVSGVLYNTELVDPVIIEGRWLLPEDERAIVVTRGVLEDDPDMTVGTEVVLSINEEESTWKVVGVATSIGDSREGYVPYEHYSRAIGEVGKISTTRIKMAPGFDIAPEVFEETLKQHFELQGITVNRVFSIDVLLERVTEQFDFIVMALLAMAILIAVVGGLGLAGTMSLNVIERIREIGVMRAIGASDSMILQIFLGEGIIIGLISWFFGAAFSFPVSKFLSDLMGQMFFRTPLTFDFSFEGMGIWLAFSTAMAILASFLPAWNAARLSIRNALAFE